MMSVLRGRLDGGKARLVSLMAMALAGQLALAIPARAQEATTDEIRVRKLEAEVRALQRQVFPGADGAAAPQVGTSLGTAPGTPATTPMTDVLTRMDVLEAQVARLTAQYEDMGNRLRQVENRLGGAPATGPAALGPSGPAPVAAPAPVPAPTPLVPVAAPASTGEAKPSAQRLAAVKAVVKPQTGDAGEDEYSYGFKLYQAKFYPEAEQQLKLFLNQYPAHRRVTYARNLIGKAFLDDGKPREAAPWFLQNYQANKHSDRAADSLLNLAGAMVQMKDTNRACIALAEFADAYKTEAGGRLKGQYDQTRASVTCN